MKVKSQELRVRSRKTWQRALVLVASLLCAAGVRGQCYIDPISGQRVCPLNQQQFYVPARPAVDTRLLTLDSAAFCRITVGDGTAGSGTLISRSAKAGLVLTCSHLFDTSTANIVVAFPNGQRLAGYIVERDRANDLTALVIARPDVAPIAVAEGDAAGTVAACGFGPNGQFRAVSGTVVGQATAARASSPSLVMSGAVRPGDSGGGVLNAAGRLVGVIWGQRDGMTYATCGRPLRALVDRVLGRQPGAGSTEGGAGAAQPGAGSTDRGVNTPTSNQSPQMDWPTWATDIEERIRALDAAKQDKGDYLQRGDLPDTSQFARRDELDGGLASVQGRFDSILHSVEVVRQRVDGVSLGQGGFFSGLSIGKLLVGALGLSGPLAAAVMVAGGLIGLRRGQRGAMSNRRPAAAEVRPVAVDSPPPPQQSVPETHYVSYETDSFAKAHQWACEQVARKYPGATELLHAQDSLIKQHLAARK